MAQYRRSLPVRNSCGRVIQIPTPFNINAFRGRPISEVPTGVHLAVFARRREMAERAATEALDKARRWLDSWAGGLADE